MSDRASRALQKVLAGVVNQSVTGAQHQPRHKMTAQTILAQIAKQHLLVDTLNTQKSNADFHEVAVWSIETALKAAFEAGRTAAKE
jgi:hypothetical protein